MLLFMLSMNHELFGNPHKTHVHADSAYIFAYTSASSNGRNGLQMAWSVDKKNWRAIGAGHSFVRCDYGRWGSEKRMYIGKSPCAFDFASHQRNEQIG